jgi:4-coumarate--CoA ligase
MHFKSKIPDLVIPKCSILDYLFPPGTEPSEKPLWINAKDESISNSPKSALLYARRLGFGLQRLGVKSGDVCMLFTPNHIFDEVLDDGAVEKDLAGAMFVEGAGRSAVLVCGSARWWRTVVVLRR